MFSHWSHGQGLETKNCRSFKIMKKNLIVTLYWIFAGLFLILFKVPGSFVLKALPALSMSFLLFSTKNRLLYAMATGFIFSATGDIFLQIDRQNFFLHGLVA